MDGRMGMNIRVMNIRVIINIIIIIVINRIR
jgi:hypothetical protein